MLHPTSYDRYEKLKLVYRRLQYQNFNRHDLDDYIQIVNARPSCIGKDPQTSPAKRLDGKGLNRVRREFSPQRAEPFGRAEKASSLNFQTARKEMHSQRSIECSDSLNIFLRFCRV